MIVTLNHNGNRESFILPNEHYVILLAHFQKQNVKVTVTKTKVSTH